MGAHTVVASDVPPLGPLHQPGLRPEHPRLNHVELVAILDIDTLPLRNRDAAELVSEDDVFQCLIVRLMSPLLRIPLPHIPPLTRNKVRRPQHSIRIPQPIQNKVPRETLGVIVRAQDLVAVFTPVEADKHTVAGPSTQGVGRPRPQERRNPHETEVPG